MRGQSLVELILIMGLMALILPALMLGFVASRQGKPQLEQRMQAVALLKETEEAVKSVRNNDWTTFATFSGTLHPVIYGTQWSFASGAQTTNSFTQQVVLGDVYRDSSGAIAASGTLDPSTKKADVTVSWTQPFISSITSTLYLTRTGSATALHTTQADFNAGIASGAAVLATGGSATDGQIELGTGGTGNWCNPNLTITALDLPKNGVANAISAIEGRVFAGTGDNASGVSFANVNITNTKPPVSSILGTSDGYKTNGVFGETNYAYLATDTNSKEIEIVNLTTSPYGEAGYFNAPGNGSGNSIYVSGTVGYMISGSTLYTFDLSSKSGSRPQLGSLALDGTGNKIYVVGNYAYVAIGSTSNQLEIVQISNGGATLSKVASFSVNGQAAKDVFINASATRAYLVTGASVTQREFFIINITNKSAPSLVSSYDTEGMSPKAVTVVTGNKAIIGGTGGEEYQVIDIAIETNPTECGDLNIDTGVNGVASVLEADGDAYSYIITGDATTELKIIEGGSGGQFTSSGTFESKVFDATSSAMFNRFVASINQPSQTTLRMQVAVRDPVSGVCPTASSAYTYVGPNGNASAYFTPTAASISGTIPFGTYSPNYTNPQRCFRYKALLDSTDNSQTPVLYDVRWNYSL